VQFWENAAHHQSVRCDEETNAPLCWKKQKMFSTYHGRDIVVGEVGMSATPVYTTELAVKICSANYNRAMNLF
jgi:hypothetical protein